MSPIKDLQRRGHQIGEIRIGMVVKPEKGKPYPSKLDSFRFTTRSPKVAQAVAQLLGGEARPTQLQNGRESWEVFTDATELPVMVPPGDAVISQWYELYSAAGCQRRCDGETEQLTQSPCKCPADPEQRNELAKSGSACKPTTRLNVMLPDLPDLGVWLLTSHGFNAAVELGGAAEVLAAAREAGVIIPATLRLEQRETRVVGQAPKKYAVPVLEIGASLRQMTELGSGRDIASALPPPPPQAVQALASGHVYSADDEPIEAEVVDSAPTEEGSLTTLLAELDAGASDELSTRMENAKFPPIDQLSPAAERQVHRWVEEIRAEQAKGAPFE
jgi:hypothetical protein